MRIELAGSGVHVVHAFLGGVDTPMHAKASRAYGRALRWMPVGRPEAAARRILTAIRRHRPTVLYPRAVATIRWLPTISAWISGPVVLPLLLGAGDRVLRLRGAVRPVLRPPLEPDRREFASPFGASFCLRLPRPCRALRELSPCSTKAPV